MLDEYLRDIVDGKVAVSTHDILMWDEVDIANLRSVIEVEDPKGAFLLKELLNKLKKAKRPTFYDIRYRYDGAQAEPTYVLPNIIYLAALLAVFVGCLLCALLIDDGLCRCINGTMVSIIMCGIMHVCMDDGEIMEYEVPGSKIFVRQCELYSKKSKLHIRYESVDRVTSTNRTIYFTMKSKDVISVELPPSCDNIDDIVEYIKARVG